MRTLILILLIATVSGCASLKERRESRKSKNDTTIVTTNTTNETTTTTVVEKVDTTINIKGDSAVITKPIDDLIKGDTLEATTNGTTVKVTYDPKTGNIRAVGKTSDRNVPIKIDKKTEIVGQKATKTDNKTESRTKEAVKTESKDREPAKNRFWWGFVFALFLVLILVILMLLRRLKII